MSFQHVLVTTDLSNASLVALKYLQRGTVLAKEFTLLYILTDWNVPAGYFDTEPHEGYFQSWRERAAEHAHEKLGRLIHEYAGGLKMKGIVSQSGRQPALEVTEYASRHHCDLILIGSKGAGALTSLVLGSVVQKVVHKSPCPVLIVPVDYESSSAE